MSQTKTEKCILCQIDTGIPINTHIDYRSFYIEGAGQLCKDCFEGSEDREMVCVPKNYFKKYPNNYDLGEKLRSFFYDFYTKTENK